MKWLNRYRIKSVLFGSVAVILIGGVKVYGDFTFGTPQNLGSTVNSLYHDAGPSLSADGLDLYFYSDRPGGSGGYDIWVSTRPEHRGLLGTARESGSARQQLL
jgi:hypothetical protein